jgi:hypothetical protein
MMTTKYYDEFLRYFELAKRQQEECNLGSIPHEESSVQDELMKHVHLYDVVERKYAGFSQIVNDVFYGWTPDHPYWSKMEAGKATWQREQISKNWTGKHSDFGLPEWLYLFLLHRITGSAINYATKPSGYHNTILFHMHEAKSIEDMAKTVKHHPFPFYTSVGYQFPSFPKPVEGYKRGGDYYLCEYAPHLAREVADFLVKGGKKDLREVGEFMFKWNNDRGLNAYRFQYAAFIADIADWYPEYVNRESPFYYGKNAIECLNYLVYSGKKKNNTLILDSVMQRIYDDTGSYPYNAEDVACDFIRWIENYIRPGKDYERLDFDKVWNSSVIKDHPFGRQRAMLDLGLVVTFNDLKHHPSDNKVLCDANLTEEEYKHRVNEHYKSN